MFVICLDSASWIFFRSICESKRDIDRKPKPECKYIPDSDSQCKLYCATHHTFAYNSIRYLDMCYVILRYISAMYEKYRYSEMHTRYISREWPMSSLHSLDTFPSNDKREGISGPPSLMYIGKVARSRANPPGYVTLIQIYDNRIILVI